MMISFTMPVRSSLILAGRSFFAIFQLLLFQVIFSSLSGQAVNTIPKGKVPVHQVDITDILRIGHGSKHDSDSTSDRGKGPFISVIPVVGYGRNTGITGVLSSSTTFYSDTARKRMSRIQFNANYSQYHQYWFTLLNNVFFDDRKLHLFGDIRYYKFPTQTYGLGPFSKNAHEIHIDYSYLRFWETVFIELGTNFYVGAGYNLDYHWNIKADTVKTTEMDQFLEYQKGHSSLSSGVSVNLLYDSRKNSVNPKGGSYINIQVRHNLKFLGSDQNWQVLLVDLRKYFRLPGSSDNILAFWSYNNVVLSGIAPYLDLPSIGWDSYSNTGRGYVPGRYTGRVLLYMESEYRFRLMRNGLLGGVVYGNVGSIPAKVPKEMAPLIPGGGLGLRIKINKHSDTNLAVDYSFGLRKSRGFTFNLGEMF
ncbi:MAG TPA: BamA/TamA family outer membrane protein [Bacteroidales bacterium]|nr:BamA/TamA family outer membrane protein [Bacteroidales bacterium]